MQYPKGEKGNGYRESSEKKREPADKKMRGEEKKKNGRSHQKGTDPGCGEKKGGL